MSQLNRGFMDRTFQPYLTSFMTRLTGKSLTVRNQFDPKFFELVRAVDKMNRLDRVDLEKTFNFPEQLLVNRVGHCSNRIQIITSDNGKAFFAIGKRV